MGLLVAASVIGMDYRPGRSGSGQFKYFRFIKLSLLVVALGFSPFTARAQVYSEHNGDPYPDTAKRADKARAGGFPAPGKSTKAAISEGFESGIMPPSAWDLISSNTSETWQVDTSSPYSGVYRAAIYEDSSQQEQDEILISPSFSSDAGSVSFWSYGSLYWCREDHDKCDLEVWFVKGDWGGGDDVLLGMADEDWSASWEWSASTFDFSEYADGEPARIAFRYSGQGGAEIALDAIEIHFGSSATCSDPYEPNDSPEQATHLEFDSTLSGVDICPLGDADFYSFNAYAGVTVMVDIDAQVLGSLLDSYIYLYDTDGVTELNQNDDWDGFDSYLEFTLPADGTYFLEVREFNHGSQGGGDYFYTISLAGTGLGVGPLQYSAHRVDDDLDGESLGNGDGIMHCGEQIELYAQLFDNGSQTAKAVTATISTSDPYITWLDNTSSFYGDIPGWGTAENLDDFDFLVAADTPNGHLIHFDLEIDAANGGPWVDSFNLPVVCTANPAQWTFMVYLDGDNNLEQAGIDDFLEMASVGSTHDLHILVQFDRIPGYDSRYGDWTGTRRFQVARGMLPTADYALLDIGEANMGDPGTLVDFAQWGINNFPAERYALVIWDHGSGWRYRLLGPIFKDVAYDHTSGYDALDMPELLAVMDTVTTAGARPLDLIGFDACLMAMIEVDNQLIPYAHTRIGSQENEPWDGWDYESSLSALSEDPSISAGDLGTVIVNDYFASYEDGQTLSALDLEAAYAQLNAAVNDFANALMAGMGTYTFDIFKARTNTQDFSNSSYIDLYDFAFQVSLQVEDSALDAAAGAVMDAVTNAVIHEQHGAFWSGAHGISIYFPISQDYYNILYDGDQDFLKFTAATLWDEWLHAFYAGTSTCFDPYESNNSPAQATGISYGVTLHDAEICPVGDEDFYVFSGVAGDRFIVDIDAAVFGSALDSYLTLLDRDGTTVLTQNDDDGSSRDSRLSYVLPQDGEYYLRVREFHHPYQGDARYYYQISLSLMPPPPEIISSRNSLPPTIDGVINAWEWAGAAVYDITLAETKTSALSAGVSNGLAEIQPGVVKPGVPRRDESDSMVKLYLMNDHRNLYLAIDNPNDTSPDSMDVIGVSFDDNPLPSDGRWTNIACGNPDGEGNFGLLGSLVQFQEWIQGPYACDFVQPAPGASGGIGYASGHIQAELTIDLKSSALQASGGDSVMVYFWIFNQSTYAIEGKWPATADDYSPATYGRLSLASPAGQWHYFPLLFK